MPFSKHFTATPPPRSTAWASVRTYEADVATPIYAAIDTQSIPVDPTPLTADPVSFDVDTCVLETGLYRFAFLTSGGAESPMSGPVLSPGPVSGYACTVAQIDAYLDRGGSAASYTELSKTDAREVATVAFEQKANLAIRSATRTDTLDGILGTDLLTPVPRPLAVTAASIGGTSIDESAVEVLTSEGLLYRAAGWGGSTRRNITLTYTHGYATTPADLSNAIAVLAASLIKDGPFDDRGYGVTDDGGFVRLLTAGVSGATFSIPDVQAALVRYRIPAIA